MLFSISDKPIRSCPLVVQFPRDTQPLLFLRVGQHREKIDAVSLSDAARVEPPIVDPEDQDVPQKDQDLFPPPTAPIRPGERPLEGRFEFPVGVQMNPATPV